MSVIRKKPEIEKILERLEAENIQAVVSAMNTSNPEAFKSLINVNYALSALSADNPVDIGAYQLQMDGQKIRNGICIRLLKDNVKYEHFLVYGESQKITIYELNTDTRTYTLIEEYCDINELRRLCGGVGGVVPVDDIYAGNVFASDEIEFSENDGDFGSNAKAKINAIIDNRVNLVADSKIEHEVEDSNTIINVAEVFDRQKAYHIYLEIENTTVHFGADFTVFPNNAVQCFSTFNMLLPNGQSTEVKECYASFDNQGTLIIDIPYVMDPSSQNTIIHYEKLF